MRILIVSRELPPRVGGAGSYTFNLASGLAEAGHSVTVVSTTYKGEEREELVVDRHLYKSGVREVIRVSFIRKMYILMIFFAVIREARKNIYDVVLVADSGAQKALSMGYPLVGIPIWIVFHGSEVKNFIRHPSLFFRLTGGWKRMRNLWEHASGCIAVSGYLSNVIIDAAPWLANKLHVVLHGIDTRAFSPDKKTRLEVRSSLKIPSDSKVIFSASRLVEMKGQDLLIKMMPDIIKTAPDTFLIIAGDGPYSKALKEISSSSGVEDRVKFVGELSREEIIRFYQACDLFALLSREVNEAFGLVYLEANACGAPVIANNHGGAREAVENNVSGILLDLCREDLSFKVAEVLSSPVLIAELSYLGLKRARESFSIKNMAINTVKTISAHTAIK